MLKTKTRKRTMAKNTDNVRTIIDHERERIEKNLRSGDVLIHTNLITKHHGIN